MMALQRYSDRPPRARISKRCRALGHAALGVMLFGTAVGCTGPSGVEGDTPDRETFIAIYVDLRIAAIDNSVQEIHPAERDSILEAYGVTADDMVAFAESYGRDVRFMTELWAEVEEMIKQRLEPDTQDEDSIGGGP